MIYGSRVQKLSEKQRRKSWGKKIKKGGLRDKETWWKEAVRKKRDMKKKWDDIGSGKDKRKSGSQENGSQSKGTRESI